MTESAYISHKQANLSIQGAKFSIESGQNMKPPVKAIFAYFCGFLIHLADMII